MATLGLIDEREKALARLCIETALEYGASAARITLGKTVQNSISVFNSEIDRISFSSDRSISACIFAGGSYGQFSTNSLEEDTLRSFIREAVENVRLLAPDPCRMLPPKQSKAYGCTRGDELELYDASFAALDQEKRTAMALEAARSTARPDADYAVEAVEAEYSDSCDDEYMTDSEGFEGRHIETAFGFCAEVTVKDTAGNRYSGYWWNSSPFLAALDISAVTSEATRRSAAKIGSRPIPPGRYGIIVDPCCSSRLVAPLMRALSAENIQQGNSFLKDGLGLKVFPGHLTISDMAVEKGCTGSRLYDSEGTATSNRVIIDKGIVRNCFTNSYMAAKTGMPHTVDNVSRACISPFIWNCSKKEINLKDIMRAMRDGVYVSSFNGGNCNEATGDFSFGIEGMLFKDGQAVHPVSEVVMTGNMLKLWNSVIAAGNDPLKCSSWQIPSLAFRDVELD